MHSSWSRGSSTQFVAHPWLLFSDFPFFYGLLPLGAGLYLMMGFAFFQLALLLLLFPAIPFYHSYCDVIWPNPAGPLWACHLFFSQWLSMAIGSFITLLADSNVPFASSWAFLAHLLFLGFLDPFPNSVFPWVFTNFFGFSRPNYLIPHPWSSWACHQSLTFFVCITLGLLWPISHFSSSHIAHGFASSRSICLFYGPMIHYFCRLGLMVFLSSYQLFSARVTGLLLSILIPKMIINTYHCSDRHVS